MSTQSRRYPSLYKDSVALMTVSARIGAVPGIAAASAVMATATNVENLARAGLGDFEARPNDLVVAVSGSDDACAEALRQADELLAARPAAEGEARAEAAAPSLRNALARDPAINLALVSVPGDYAAAEAMKALQLGLHVMLFSDNVPIEQELALKSCARDRGLLVMGPDCGTAIVNGMPLGFANAVRRGTIGVVGASGTGTQEVTARVHQLGEGVSQALGTGGHDLSAAIGGVSMLQGLRMLAADATTRVIVLVSKPPAPEVAARVLAAASAAAKPVVAVFLGQDGAAITRGNIRGADTLAQAADFAAALARGDQPTAAPPVVAEDIRHVLDAATRKMASPQCHVRGVFCGGTFCYEAQLVHAAMGICASSNTPIAGNRALADAWRSEGDTFVDMGDDAFTQGRPHPMIDPSLRDARLRDEAADPATAVVLFDVVLGYGAADDPVSGLLGVIAAARAQAGAEGRAAAFIGHVCGTDLDPQDRAAIVADLKEAGVLVASSNAEAAAWSAAIVAQRRRATP